MFHKSIRFRIQFWHSLLLIITTVGLSISYYYYEKQNRIQLVDIALQNESVRFVTTADRYIADRFPEIFPRPIPAPNRAGHRPPIRRPQGRPQGPNQGREQGRAQAVPLSLDEREDLLNTFAESTNTFLYVWDKELKLVYRTRNASLTPPVPPTLPANVPARRFISNNETRSLITGTLIGATIGLSKDTRELEKSLKTLILTLIGIDILVITLGVSVGWILTGRAIRPIHLINETAGKIASGQRNKRIDSSITDCELSQLAKVLNETFDKLDHSFDQQVKFTADASHELRTPVAAMLTQIQLALSKDREVEEYKEHLLACQGQAVHMRNLLNSLLDLARSDSGEIEFLLADYDLSELILECCEWLESLAAERQVELQTKLTSVTAQIDGLRMSQVLTNIISNAIHHSPPSSRILISLTTDNDTAIIAIKDQGPGIPEEAKDHIFERFYRASKSRTARQGSVGLGLAIAKTIVDKHKGQIMAESDSNGTTFTVTLPLKA